MDKLKELFSLVIGSRLIVEGDGRTFAKVPMWLAVPAALSSLRLTALTVVLIIAFGLRVRVDKA